MAVDGIGVGDRWLLSFNEEFTQILRPTPLAR